MLKQIIENLGYVYVEVDALSEEKIIKLFRENIKYKPETACEYLYLGVYNQNKKNKVDAHRCYEKAANLGDSTGFYNLGNLYYDNKDWEKAEFYYKKAAELGHITAVNDLGYLFQHSHHNTEKANFFYKQAAELGDTSAMFNLSTLLMESDPSASEFYYKQASEKGHKRSLEELLSLYAKQNRHEEAFLLAHKYQTLIGENKLVETLSRLKYPISNKDQVYAVLETLDLSSGLMINSDVLRIMQDAISRKVKVLCDIAYQYKKYNNS